MGNYATAAELISRFANEAEVSYLTDTEATGTADAGVLADCLEDAEAEINTWIAQRYKTPVDVSVDTELARLLKRKTLDIAETYLLMRGPSIAENKTAQLERTIEWAKAVGMGQAQLTGAVTATSTTTRTPLATWTGANRDLTNVETRLCSRETMGSL